MILLAGGSSSRMGYPKAFLQFQGKTVLKTILDTYSPIVQKYIIVINHQFAGSLGSDFLEVPDRRITIIENHFPEYGKFYSLRLAASFLQDPSKPPFRSIGKWSGIRNPETFYTFIQPVDNLPSVETLRLLAQNRNPEGYTVPLYNGKGGHPILVSPRVLSGIIAAEALDIHLKDFLSQYSRINIAGADAGVLTNWNTPEEFAQQAAGGILA